MRTFYADNLPKSLSNPIALAFNALVSSPGTRGPILHKRGGDLCILEAARDPQEELTITDVLRELSQRKEPMPVIVIWRGGEEAKKEMIEGFNQGPMKVRVVEPLLTAIKTATEELLGVRALM